MIKKFSWLKKDLIGISLTSLFNDFNYEMTTAILPTFIQQFTGKSSAPVVIGIIMGFADAGSMVMKLLSGWLSNHIKYFKPILIIGYSITPICTSLLGTATKIWHIFTFQVIAWMGRGLRDPIKDVWLSNISNSKDYGKVYGFERSMDTIGAIAGPLLAFFTIKIFSIRSNFFISFIPGIISIITVIFLTSNYKQNRYSIPKINLGKQIIRLPSTFKYFSFVMFIFGIANFNRTLLIYRAQEMLLGQLNSSIIATGSAILFYVLFNFIRSISEIGMGSLSDYINKKILLGFFGFGSFFITIFTLLFAKTHIILWILIFITAGISTGTITAVEKSYCAELLPENMRGIGFGFIQSIDGLGDLLSSAIVGGLWSYISAEVSFIYSLILTLLAFILILNIKKSNTNQLLAE